MEEFLEFAVDLAREAGSELRHGFGQLGRDEVSYKGWRNLVTHFDVEVERQVVERITARYPEHGILAEEGTRRTGVSEFRWVIDPLDGTTNYVHRHPMYCVSIGLADQQGPLVGVVYAPQLEELFTCARGGGARFNFERPLRVSGEQELNRALLASGFAYRQDEKTNNNLGNWAALSKVSRGLRRCGAAALDLAYVADGRYDGFWELNLYPWDVAAGALLVREAGGRVTDVAGGTPGRTAIRSWPATGSCTRRSGGIWAEAVVYDSAGSGAAGVMEAIRRRAADNRDRGRRAGSERGRMALDIRESMKQMQARHPRVRWEVLSPGQVQRFLTKLGYESAFDRCKYDVIYFQEDSQEKAMVVWGLVE